MDIVFEPMRSEHAGPVISIFNHYIETSFAAYMEHPLPEQAFSMLEKMTNGYPSFVMKEESGKVIGFCFLHPFNPMPTFRETAEITYFIAPEAVGHGLGSKALSLLEQEAKKKGIRHILASISSHNEGSVRFHRTHGFRDCGRFDNIGTKKGKPFDVIYLQKDL